MRKKTFYAGKKPYRNYRALAAYAIVIVAAAAVITGLVFGIKAIVSYSREKKNSRAANFGEYTWETEGFADYSDIRSLGEKFLVYKKGSSGLMGLMSLDGSVISPAEYSEFSIVEEPWRTQNFLAKKPDSEYRLVINAETGKVTSKQYRAPIEPVGVAYWDTTANTVSWYDGVGYVGRLSAAQIALPDGLYPVEGHDATAGTGKSGYIDQTLSLAVALDYDEAHEFSCGRGGVLKGKSCGYLGDDGKVKIPLKYESVAGCEINGEVSVFSFCNGYAPAKKNGKMGIIDTAGKEVVGFKFDMILPGSNGVYIAKDGGKWGKLTVAIPESEKAEKTTVASTSAQSDIAAGIYIVNTSKDPLNIRAEASAKSTIVAQIPKGTSVEVSKAANGWAYVKYHSPGGKDFVGWAKSQFLKKADTATTAATSVAASSAATEASSVTAATAAVSTTKAAG